MTGIDLAPALIETARERAESRGLEIDCRVGDCENLVEVADGEFDVLSSCFGIMFSPDHEATARELAREEHVSGLLGDAFELRFEHLVSPLRGSPEDTWDLFSSSFGPVKTLAESLDEGRREEFRRAWVEFYEEEGRLAGDVLSHPREYLLVLGTRR